MLLLSPPVAVEAGRNVSVNVVFLPLVEGEVSGWLYVQTSLGAFSYRVTGRGVANVYGVGPLLNMQGASRGQQGAWRSHVLLGCSAAQCASRARHYTVEPAH